MRLLPMKDADKSWRAIKAQWKKDAESVGEDFSTFSMGGYAAFDALTKDGDHPTLYCLSDGEKIHAACQVSRLMMSKFPTPILRARFVSVSPVYELGVADSSQYAQILVALFSGIVWLSRDSLSAGHIRFFLKSPGDAQFFAALQASTPLSLFSKFSIEGGLIECSLKEAEASETAQTD
jgi:hypothetical protein